MIRILTIVGLLNLLSGCSWREPPGFTSSATKVRQTVDTLPRAEPTQAAMTQFSVAELINQLEKIDNAALEYDITNRLAQLRLE